MAAGNPEMEKKQRNAEKRSARNEELQPSQQVQAALAVDVDEVNSSEDQKVLYQERRLDSIAMILEIRGAICGAVCFIDNRLYMAVNKVDLAGNSFAHASDFLKSCIEFAKKYPTGQIKEKDKVERTLTFNNLAEIYTKDMAGSARRAFEKIQRSIIHTYIKGKKPLKSDLIKAIEDSSLVNVIEQGKGGDVHAEMKIINQLIKDGLFERKSEKEKIYIGISRKCCRNCEIVIEAVNDLLEEKGSGKIIVIKVRSEGSGMKFPSAMPLFIVEDGPHKKEIRDKIEHIMKANGIKGEIEDMYTKPPNAGRSEGNTRYEPSSSDPSELGDSPSPKNEQASRAPELGPVGAGSSDAQPSEMPELRETLVNRAEDAEHPRDSATLPQGGQNAFQSRAQ